MTPRRGDPSPILRDLAEQIREFLVERSMEKQELARRLGVSRSYITQLLSGNRNMTTKTISNVATVLGLRVSIKFEKE